MFDRAPRPPAALIHGVIARLVAMLAVALLIAGCGSLIPSGPAVQLLTGDPSQVELLGRSDACFMDMAEGPLTADPTYGTMIEIRHQEIIYRESPYPRLPVVWLPGFTVAGLARRSRSSTRRAR
jgi:hypothetical protein